MTDRSKELSSELATDEQIRAWKPGVAISVASLIARIKAERKNNTDCALAYQEGYLRGLIVAGAHGPNTDKLLQAICDDVEREYEMGGLSRGLYGDYAKDVALRYTKALSEGYVI